MKYLLFFSLLFGLAHTKMIEAIKFKDLVHLSPEVATTILGVTKGTLLDEAQLDRGIKKLFEQGYFKDIWVEEENGVLTVHCVEKPIISNIKIDGFIESDEEKREEIMQLKKGQIYDEKSLENSKQRILAYLEQEGAIDSVVEVEVTRLKNGSVELEFFVNEGKEITIKSLILHGVNKLDEELLTDTIANNEAQSFGWWFGRHNGELKLPELKIDPLRMADIYRQNGYLDVDVKSPLLRVDFNTYDAELSYKVTEGVQYKVKKVGFSGNGEIVKDKEIEELIKLELNKPFNVKTLRDDMTRIKTKISDFGYAYVKINPDLKKDKESATVEVTYHIVPGEKVYIRDVLIVGNDRTLDRVIRRDVYLAPGDLYSGSDLKDSKNALGRTGYFESTTIEEKRVSSNRMDLIVHVKEAPTGNVQIGGGYGSYGGFSFDASLSDKNIFGSGLNAGIKLQTSQYSKTQSFNLSNPRINDSDYSGSMSLYQREFELIDTYRTKSSGVSFHIGKRFTRTLSGSIGYGYSSTAYPYINPDANLTAEQTQEYTKSSVTMSLGFNNTDDFYVPRSGIKLSDSIEYAGLGSEAQYFKNYASFAAFKGFRDSIDIDAVLRFKINARWINDYGFVPLDQHFYMGGLGSVRGYDQYSIPSYETGTFTRTFYAKKNLTQSLELSFPLVDSARLRWALFVDYGYIGVEEFDEEKRGGYGAQIEWFSPMGPIALIFSRAFEDEVGDRVNNFEFSIGRPF